MSDNERTVTSSRTSRDQILMHLKNWVKSQEYEDGVSTFNDFYHYLENQGIHSAKRKIKDLNMREDLSNKITQYYEKNQSKKKSKSKSNCPNGYYQTVQGKCRKGKLQPCPSGYSRNSVTNRCYKNRYKNKERKCEKGYFETRTGNCKKFRDVSCSQGEGWTRNPDTGRCVKNPLLLRSKSRALSVSSKATCPHGHYQTITGKCIPFNKNKPCRGGDKNWERNPKTGRCTKKCPPGLARNQYGHCRGKTGLSVGRRSPTPSVGRRSPSVGRRSPTPSVGRRTPSVGQRTPSVGQRTPSVGQRSPSVGRRSPSVGRRSPSVGRKSPSVGRKSPSVGRRSPSVGRRSPSVGRRSPSVGRRSPSPSVGQRSPSVGRRSPTPSVGQRSPSVGQRSPSVGRRSPTPLVGQRSPSVGRKSPSVGRKSPSVGRKSPSVGRKSPSPKQNQMLTASSLADIYMEIDDNVSKFMKEQKNIPQTDDNKAFFADLYDKWIDIYEKIPNIEDGDKEEKLEEAFIKLPMKERDILLDEMIQLQKELEEAQEIFEEKKKAQEIFEEKKKAQEILEEKKKSTPIKILKMWDDVVVKCVDNSKNDDHRKRINRAFKWFKENVFFVQFMRKESLAMANIFGYFICCIVSLMVNYIHEYGKKLSDEQQATHDQLLIIATTLYAFHVFELEKSIGVFNHGKLFLDRIIKYTNGYSQLKTLNEKTKFIEKRTNEVNNIQKIIKVLGQQNPFIEKFKILKQKS